MSAGRIEIVWSAHGGVTAPGVRVLPHEITGAAQIENIARPVDRSELYVATEDFFAGTAFEIAPIFEMDRHLVETGCIGHITRRLQEA